MKHVVKMALAMAGAFGVGATPVQAEPLKVAIIESLSGAQTSTGRLFASGVHYGISQLNGAGGFNGEPVEVVEYDNAGGAVGAADKFRQAAADGAHIIFQGGSSAIAGQLTEDVRKHNLRNEGDEILFMNIGGEAMELTGSKCHFYHFRFTTTAPMRVNALTSVMKEAGELGDNVYSMNQNYSWGQDMQDAIAAASVANGYTVVDSVLHDVNKIQDFAPFVARIKAANPSTVITGNWSNDLLLLMKAAGDAGLDVRFGTAFLDQPGNIANAGKTALGHYIANNYTNSAGSSEFAEDYKEAMGHYPTFVEPQSVFAVNMLASALSALDFGGGDIDVKSLAFALEGSSFDGPIGKITVRAEDHQTIRPVVVSKVVENATYKSDDTNLGFEAVKVVAPEDAIYPVQASCSMNRPG